MTLQQARQGLIAHKTLLGQKNQKGEIVNSLFIVTTESSKIGKFISLAYQTESFPPVVGVITNNSYSA